MTLCLLDRDGVIVKEQGSGCLFDPMDVVLEEGAAKGLKHLHDHDVTCVVVTNQSCIGKGLCSSKQVLAVHKEITKQVADAGGCIEAFYYCPHRTEDECGCRKPATGLLIRAFNVHDFSPSSSWLVGDALGDLQAANTFGISHVLVRTGKGRETEKTVVSLGWKVSVVDTLEDVARLITDG